MLLDAGVSSTDMADLNSTVDSTDYGAGIYGGGEFGGTRVSVAGTYRRHDNASSRSVEFPGFTEDLSASYASATWQLAGQVSHALDFGAFGLSPYLGAS